MANSSPGFGQRECALGFRVQGYQVAPFPFLRGYWGTGFRGGFGCERVRTERTLRSMLHHHN